MHVNHQHLCKAQNKLFTSCLWDNRMLLFILWLIDIYKGTNLGCRKWNMFISHYNFKFLSSNTIWCWPQRIIFLQDFRIFNDSLQFIQNTLMNIGLREKTINAVNWNQSHIYKIYLFSDHGIIFVVGIVCVSKFA